MEAFRREDEMSKLVLSEKETFKAKRRKLNEVKIGADLGVIAARNERLEAIGKERA